MAEDIATKATTGQRDRISTAGWLIRPLAIYAASRLLMLAATFATIASHANLTWNGAIRAWDGGWYLEVARYGYPHGVPTLHGRAIQSTLGFFPLFPLSLRALHAVTGLSYLTAGVVITGAFGAAFAVLLWWLLRSVFDRAAADRATALVCFFPGFFVFGLLYSEPLSLTLTVICLIALLRRWWWVAGAAAGLASATRPNAAVLVIVCAWAAAVAIRRRREWVAVVAPLLAPAGVLAQFTFLYFRTGHFLAYETVQAQGWQFRLRPREPFYLASHALRHPFHQWDVTLPALGAIFIVVAGVLLLRSGYPDVLIVYGVALGVLNLFLAPTPRFVMTAFPLIVVVALRLKGLWYWLALVISAGALAGLLVLTLLMKATP